MSEGILDSGGGTLEAEEENPDAGLLVLDRDDGEDSISQLAISSARMSAKERAFTLAKLSGKSDLEAAKIAGYRNVNAAVASMRRKLDPALFNVAAFSMLGFGPVEAAKKLVALTEATDTKVLTHLGSITGTVDVPNRKVQVEATRAVIALSGMEPARKQDIAIENNTTITVVPEGYREMSDEELLERVQKAQLLYGSRR